MLMQTHAAGVAAKTATVSTVDADSVATDAEASNVTQYLDVSENEGIDSNTSKNIVDPVDEVEPDVPVTPPKDTSGAITSSAGVAWSCLALALLVAAAIVHRTVEKPGPNEQTLFSMYLAEFVGTFMLIFSVGCNVLVGDGTWAVVSIACTLMVSIYALGGISGGNFNPAVSVCLGVARKMAWSKVIVYVLVQLAAGVTAGLAYGFMLGKTFNLAPAEGFSGLQAGLAELFFTFMLTFVVLNTACSKAHAGKDQFYGLAIGFSVIAGGYSGGAISGGCFNPAVALGIDASSSAFGFGWCFHYWAFEIAGCIIAALLFSICRQGDPEPIPDLKLPAKLLSEFLGTFMLVLTVGLNVLAGSKAAVFSIAATLMCMIFALGSVSGAHFNPAVTVAIVASRRDKISTMDALCYIVVQLFAGVCAAFTYCFIHNGKTVPLQPSDSFNQAMMGEFIFTFLLAYVVLSVATTKKPLDQYFGLAIGSCVTAGGLAIGSLSGGSLNPAVSAGLAFSHGGASISNCLAYASVEVAGGVLAATVFSSTHHKEFEK